MARGRDINAGVDCFGLVAWFYAEGADIAIPDPLEPGGVDGLMQAFRQVDEPAFGDVVRLVGIGEEEHLGVWLPEGILHAARTRGVLLTPHGRIGLRGCFRWREWL